MQIKFSLSGFIRGTRCPFDIYSEEFRKHIIGIPVYLYRYKHVGRIVDIDPDLDLIYAEIDDVECRDWILESKGYNCCSFEITKE